MKLRVVQQVREKLILCPNGSFMKADHKTLQRLLTGFKTAKNFKGKDGCWNIKFAKMEDVAGITLAFVDDSNKLVILSDQLFVAEKQTVYISATEFAKLHGKSRPSVKNMCAAGRIPGAYKTSSGWLIPEDAKYPERKTRATK